MHLNGIISPDEFRESIARINRSISSNKLLIISVIIFAIAIFVGTIFYIVGGVTATKYDRYIFSPFFIAGIVLSILGSLLFTIASVLIQVRRAAQLRQAVADESTKYSTRSPVPCSWRLETATYFVGRYANRNRRHPIGHVSLVYSCR